MKGVVILLAILLAIVVLVLIGLGIKPTAFPKFSQQEAKLETVPLPTGLPAPVERFYRVTYGDQVPVIKTAVVSGRGWMRFFNLHMPIRFRFTHESGQSYRHDIDLTFFGLPWMQAFETFIDGKGWANTPGIHEGDGFDQGSNVSLWAEALNWFPAVLVTDPRVTWKPVDDATALLSVPFRAGQEVFVVRFDPESGKVTNIEAMKFNSDLGKKAMWNNGVWFHDGKPWISMDVETVEYNQDVAEYIRAPRP